MVASTKILISTAGLTWHVKNMPAAGTISSLFYITIFTTGFKNGSYTYRQALKKPSLSSSSV